MPPTFRPAVPADLSQATLDSSSGGEREERRPGEKKSSGVRPTTTGRVRAGSNIIALSWPVRLGLQQRALTPLPLVQYVLPERAGSAPGRCCSPQSDTRSFRGDALSKTRGARRACASACARACAAWQEPVQKATGNSSKDGRGGVFGGSELNAWNFPICTSNQQALQGAWLEGRQAPAGRAGVPSSAQETLFLHNLD